MDDDAAGLSTEDALEDDDGDLAADEAGAVPAEEGGVSPTDRARVDHSPVDESLGDEGAEPGFESPVAIEEDRVEGVAGPPPGMVEAEEERDGSNVEVDDDKGAEGSSAAENNSPQKPSKSNVHSSQSPDLGKPPDERIAKVIDRQQLCVDLLMVGCVQSFVDFFYIAHRKPAPSDSGAEQESPHVEIPEETLVFLKETLEMAESARRAKNYQHCFESYNALAEYFERVQDLQSAVYFHRRCAEVAAEIDARESVARANLNLGSCEEQAKNWRSAMEFHEKALEIATLADSMPLQVKAASHLTHVYDVLAETCEKEGRDAEATALYERCLSCAQLSKDPTLEGQACHKLGLSMYKTGQHEPAIQLQKRYLDICRTHDDRVGESAARAALAQCYEASGNTQEAIKQLENLLNVASEAGELRPQASACLNLGILYSGRGDHKKSVELLEQHFDLARQLGDRRLIDSSRVVLGMVRGNGKLKSYINLVNNDLEKLLKWKSKRVALDDA